LKENGQGKKVEGLKKNTCKEGNKSRRGKNEINLKQR